MKQTILLTGGVALLLMSAACSKKIAAAPPPPAPVPAPVASTPAPAKTVDRTPTPQQAPARPVAQTPQRPTSITPEDRATLNQMLARMEDALFDYDKSTIRPDASSALKDDASVVREILAKYPSQKLLIEGHADERGSEEYNLALGDKRARAAEEFLVSMGIPNNQLTLISYGKDRPTCTEETEQCWQRNRRAHMTAAP